MLNFIFLLLTTNAHAEIKYSAESYLYGQRSQVAAAILNPGNQVLREAYQELDVDWRGELKWQTDNSQAIVRPRFTAYSKDIETSNEASYAARGFWDLTDAFLENNWSSQFSTTLGLQVYQWGPSEVINATNPLYHFDFHQRSLLYKEKGQALLRANYLFNSENSLVLLVEPISNLRREWIAEDSFEPKAILKYEKIWSGTADQIGFVVGRAEKKVPFVGQYFNWSFAEGFSFYGDIKESEKKVNYKPVVTGSLISLDPSESKTDWNTLGVLGLRYEGDFDIRLEYIYNQAGFDQDEFSQVMSSLQPIANPYYVQNLQRFNGIGLELLSKEYLYLSYRITEPLSWSQSNIYLRRLWTVQGQSSQSQVEFDKSVSDSLGIFGGLSVADGAPQSELRLLSDWSFFAGVKWSL